MMETSKVIHQNKQRKQQGYQLTNRTCHSSQTI